MGSISNRLGADDIRGKMDRVRTNELASVA
jgi:hypothetical protein